MNVGIGFMVLGAMLIIGSFIYQPTVSNGYLDADTYNLGLLQFQLMLLHSGLGLFISGAIFYSIGLLLERLENSGVIEKQPDAIDSDVTYHDSEELECEWCDKSIQSPMVPCSAVYPENRVDRFSKVTSEECLASIKDNCPESLK